MNLNKNYSSPEHQTTEEEKTHKKSTRFFLKILAAVIALILFLILITYTVQKQVTDLMEGKIEENHRSLQKNDKP